MMGMIDQHRNSETSLCVHLYVSECVCWTLDYNATLQMTTCSKLNTDLDS